jgi:hypothetical protein
LEAEVKQQPFLWAVVLGVERDAEMLQILAFLLHMQQLFPAVPRSWLDVWLQIHQIRIFQRFLC